MHSNISLLKNGSSLSGHRRTGIGLLLVMAMLLLTGCPVLPPVAVELVPGGDVERGREVLRNYGCGSCHHIPGVAGANGFVGPPLDHWAQRHYVAGLVSNTPENLIVFIRNPQSIATGTAMPDLGVPEHDARDMAAYLYMLGR
jgi:cytochrome c2